MRNTLRVSLVVAVLVVAGPRALRGQDATGAALPRVTFTIGTGRLVPVGDPYRFTDRTIHLHQRPGAALRAEAAVQVHGPISLRGSMTQARQNWELRPCWSEGCTPPRDVGHYEEVRLRYYELGARIDLLRSALGRGQNLFLDLGGGRVDQALTGPEWGDVSPRRASNGTGSVGVGMSTGLAFGLAFALEVEDKLANLTPIQGGTSRKLSHSVGLTAGLTLQRF
jgi:hypothetical protein